MNIVVGTVRFLGWALGAGPGALLGWWLGGYAHVIYLPPDITYRLIAAVVVGVFAGAMTVEVAETATRRWVPDEQDRQVKGAR